MTQLTVPTLKLLRVMLESPEDQYYGLELSKRTGLASGSLYPILMRLEKAQLLESEWEEIDQVKEGRKARKYYRLTQHGIRRTKQALEKQGSLHREILPRMKYELSPEKIISMIDDCLENAEEIVSASRLLLESNLHALASSLAVIALEEIAKIILIDGTMNYRKGDGKIKKFSSDSEKHSIKLDVLETFRGHSTYFGTILEQYGETPFNKTDCIDSWQNLREDLEILLREEFRLNDLDNIKQLGFYVNLRENPRIPIPSKSIDKQFAFVLVAFSEQTLAIMKDTWLLARPYYPSLINDIRKYSEHGQDLPDEIKFRIENFITVLDLNLIKLKSVVEETLINLPNIISEHKEAVGLKVNEFGISVEDLQLPFSFVSETVKTLAKERKSRRKDELISEAIRTKKGV